MDAEKKAVKKVSYGELVAKLLDSLAVCVDEEKEGRTTISSKDAKILRKELIAAEKESLVVSKDTLLNWAFLVHDFNRIHVFGDYAREKGFETTPLHGTLIAAGYEMYVRRVCEAIYKITGKGLVYSGQAVKLREPSYTRRYLKGGVSWCLENIVKTDAGIDLAVSGINSKKQRAVSFYHTQLRNELEKPDSDFVTPFTVPGNVIERSNIEIKKGEREASYYCLGKKPREEILMMHPASFIVSTVLKLSSRRTGSPEGKYMSMDLNFHNIPGLGIFETMIRLPKPPRKAEGYFIYVFDAYCVQNDMPIVSGRVTCSSEKEIKLD
ncbi:hypothetical protein A3K73_04520 [Candidatus Pacearchaeota archaeon RBG_13_36_9]|nr:MAG: hypothetical protein A3K73_04520 [Candidatus Pacearchaeota archaeon RBG_13_36_9]